VVGGLGGGGLVACLPLGGKPANVRLGAVGCGLGLGGLPAVRWQACKPSGWVRACSIMAYYVK
jgi:hypothetical protein